MRTINSKSTEVALANTRSHQQTIQVAPALQRRVHESQPLRFDKRVTRMQRFPVEAQLARLPQKTHLGIFLDIRV